MYFCGIDSQGNGWDIPPWLGGRNRIFWFQPSWNNGTGNSLRLLLPCQGHLMLLVGQRLVRTSPKKHLGTGSSSEYPLTLTLLIHMQEPLWQIQYLDAVIATVCPGSLTPSPSLRYTAVAVPKNPAIQSALAYPGKTPPLHTVAPNFQSQQGCKFDSLNSCLNSCLNYLLTSVLTKIYKNNLIDWKNQ